MNLRAAEFMQYLNRFELSFCVAADFFISRIFFVATRVARKDLDEKTSVGHIEFVFWKTDLTERPQAKFVIGD